MTQMPAPPESLPWKVVGTKDVQIVLQTELTALQHFDQHLQSTGNCLRDFLHFISLIRPNNYIRRAMSAKNRCL